MPLRTAKPGEKLDYGVWALPVSGPNHEIIIAAVRSDGRMVGGPVTVPWGADSLAVVDDLWHLLELNEPPHRPMLRVSRTA